MFLTKLRVLRSHGIQYIKELDKVRLPEQYRGCPVIAPTDTTVITHISKHHALDQATAGNPEELALAALCPTGAISAAPLSIDLGRCIFCGECAHAAPHRIKFSNEFRMAAASYNDLVITPGAPHPHVDPAKVRAEIKKYFGRALKLRQVSAGGDNASEMELNASMNVNFDFPRYGVEFVASPRHADGIVITGPITANMAEPLEICYHAVPSPKIIILAGTDAISGGLFAGSKAIDRGFLDRHTPDLLVPGHPVHPMTFIAGVRAMIDKKR